MTVCLDTVFLIDLLLDEPSARKFAQSLQEPAAISSVSFYELLFGVTGRRRLEQVEAFAADYAVLPADYEVCAAAAAIQSRLRESGQLIPVLDAIIAATAILADAPLVTADEHFRRIPPDFRLALRAY